MTFRLAAAVGGLTFVLASAATLPAGFAAAAARGAPVGATPRAAGTPAAPAPAPAPATDAADLITQTTARLNGHIDLTDQATTYHTAPAPPTATRPAKLRVTRRGQALRVGWSAAANAARYLVAVSMTDGRVLEIPAAAGRRIVNVDAVPTRTGATVSVAGITADGRLGPRASARLRPLR